MSKICCDLQTQLVQFTDKKKKQNPTENLTKSLN